MKKVITLVLSVLVLMSGGAALAGNPFKDLVKQFKREVKQEGEALRGRLESQLREQQLGAENRALVHQPELSRRPSWILTTVDGRTMQVRNIGFVTAPFSHGAVLAVAERAEFNHAGGQSYRVRVEYPQLTAASNSTLGRVASNAINNVAASESYSSFTTEIRAITGLTLDGMQWTLLPSTAIKSLERVK